jgi:putative MATE family efflux protein
MPARRRPMSGAPPEWLPVPKPSTIIVPCPAARGTVCLPEQKMSRLVERGIARTLVSMAVPMLAGTFALNAYNLADTWYVARLGTGPLAAMSFTFPVVMFLGFFARGISTGAMAVVAHALGANRHEDAAALATHASLLCAMLGSVLGVAGWFSIRPVFIRLGASGEILRLAEQYMRIWYLGMVVRVLQVLFNDVVIGTGHTKASSSLMVLGTVLNFIVDPLLIFGLLGFPKMGIRGAAVATVFSEAVVMVGGIVLLYRRYRLLCFTRSTAAAILASWGRVLRIGAPSTLSSVLTPLSTGVVTRIVAGFGPAAVAAFGVGGRIEMFSFMIPMTVGMSLLPFMAQNYGAGRLDRVRSAYKGATVFALCFGLIIAAAFTAAARPMAGFFSRDPAVIHVLVRYIRITCFGYGMLEVHRYATFCMTGIHRPMISAGLNALRLLAFLIPLSFLGAWLAGLTGMFWGRLATDLLAAGIGVLIVLRRTRLPAL